jgi:hypothetical protein
MLVQSLSYSLWKPAKGAKATRWVKPASHVWQPIPSTNEFPLNSDTQSLLQKTLPRRVKTINRGRYRNRLGGKVTVNETFSEAVGRLPR